MSHTTSNYAETLISTRPELERVADEARGAGEVGLDTEFMREKTYRARLCLVQIATREHISLIDPERGLEVDPVASLVADESVRVILHAGRQDLEILYQSFGAAPRNIFDVQLAAGFAGYGANLPYGRLVQDVLGVMLEKGESYTDWCRRPLTRAQLRYAADDVRYLIAIAAKLEEQLREQGRWEWVLEEMHTLENEGLYASDPNEVWRRVTGRGALSSKQVGVLRAVARWREETAATRDIPRGWVVKDPSLIEIARRAPKSMDQLRGIRGLNPREADRSGAEILRAVEEGLAAPEVVRTKSPPREAQTKARMLSGLADAIIRARSEQANIATELVSTRGDLEAMLTDLFAGSLDENAYKLLRGWRRELAGQAVLDLASGRVAVKVTDRRPFIEELPLN